MGVPRGDPLAESRVALRTGDAATARRLLAHVDPAEASGEELEALAHAAYLELDFAAAAEQWERAYAAHRRAGDRLGAVRVARSVACIHLVVFGDRAVAGGWLARARSLSGAAEGSREAGWVALDLGMFELDRVRKEQCYARALAVARDVGDTDLEMATLAYLGASLVHRDRVDEGMAMLDEALAAVAGGDVGDVIVLEEIFCQLFAACEHARDVRRADEWIRVGEAVARRRRLPAVSAFCRTHYGGVLTTAGRWPEAEEALTAAVRLWGLSRRSGLRAGALVRLADLRARQGRFEEAEQLLEDVDEEDVGVVARTRAAVLLARGETERAGDTLERALAALDPGGSEAVPLWAGLVDVHLAAGRLDEAGAAAACAERGARRSGGAYPLATAALARAQVCLAGGSDPCACLREALAGFTRAQTPVEAARCRLALARAVAADRPAVARAEARAALEEFRRLNATRDADAATALLRTLGVRPPPPPRAGGPLTRREAEVLDLLGHGLSNPEIATRLFLSRRTVEHHVASVLAKLGLRSRAEAAAYATRQVGGRG
ncbi:LuxR C-terminal-related transcriptional regulator [Geodermatophilus sp. SYSU D00758]